MSNAVAVPEPAADARSPWSAGRSARLRPEEGDAAHRAREAEALAFELGRRSTAVSRRVRRAAALLMTVSPTAGHRLFEEIEEAVRREPDLAPWLPLRGDARAAGRPSPH